MNKVVEPVATATLKEVNKLATALARHALGLDGLRTKSYRNYFVTGEGCPDHAEWMRMVAIGDAVRFDGKHLHFGGDDMFRLTLKGATAVLRPAESLDREDFPSSDATRSGSND